MRASAPEKKNVRRPPLLVEGRQTPERVRIMSYILDYIGYITLTNSWEKL